MAYWLLAVVQLLSPVHLFVIPRTVVHQATLFSTVSQTLLQLMSIELVMLFNHCILCRPLLLLPLIFARALGAFPVSQFFTSGGQYIVASASDLPMNIQRWLPLGLIVWSCSSRDTQESSPAPKFESINSLALSFIYGPVLTSILDYWENHSFDNMNLCWQSDVSAFLV